MDNLRTILVSICLLFLFNQAHTQYKEPEPEYVGNKSSEAGYASLGLGLGLTYGALGGRLGFNVVDNLNLFMGLGYNFAGLGYNFGLRVPMKTQSRTEFYFLGMYGANASSKVEGAPEYDGVYTGATLGIGLKLNSKKSEGNYWDIGLLLPFRNAEYDKVVDDIKNDPRIEEFIEPLPILLNIGFNFRVSNN